MMYECFGSLKFDCPHAPYDIIQISDDDIFRLKSNALISNYIEYKSNYEIIGFTKFKNDLYMLNNQSQIILIDDNSKITRCTRYPNLTNIYSTDLYLIVIKHQNTLHVYKNKIDLWSNNCTTYTLSYSIQQISCGKEHILILLANFDLYSFGYNKYGQLGLGDCHVYTTPQKIQALSGLNIIKVVSDGWHNCALADTGDIYTWGWNENGQLGLMDKCDICKDLSHNDPRNLIQSIPHPIIINEETFVKDILCGSRHTIALAETGELFGCGWNKYGQLALPKDVIKETQFTKIPKDQSQRQINRLFGGGWTTIIEWKDK